MAKKPRAPKSDDAKSDDAKSAEPPRVSLRPIDPDGPPDPEPPEPEPPEPPEPEPPPQPSSPITSSITSWTRLEPRCRDAEMRSSTSARVFDPLWLLSRQWQLGEFQAEDTGSQVQARVRATSAMLTRCYLGELPANSQIDAPLYDPRRMPLEAIVERRRMRAADPNDPRLLVTSVEAGLHFLRMLESQPLSKSYRAALVARFALQPLSAQALQICDGASARFMQTMQGRAPDARRLAAAFRSGRAAQVVLEAALAIVSADHTKVVQTANEWLTWYDTLFSEPADTADDAWIPSRLEYAVSVSARLSTDTFGERTLSASEFNGGQLDWSSFDFNGEVNMGTAGDQSFSTITETTVPAPVTIRGTPATRFWELEDARIDYGLLPTGPTDLAQLMMIEYVGSYGNDWFVVPFTLPVGSMTRVNSLVVTDTFGVRSLIRPIGDPVLPAPHWSMWQMAYLRRPGAEPVSRPMSNLFFLPPALGRSMDGTALEDVLFMRDEMANLAWAIERSIESPIEQTAPCSDRTTTSEDEDADTVASEGIVVAPPRYLLSSAVPTNWIPLLPVQQAAGAGRIVSRLKRGAVLQADGSAKVTHAQSRVLNSAAELLLYDEEIPREGVRVTQQRRLSRWIDGSTWVWTAYRKQVGRGEGSSGLQFDQLIERNE